MRGKLNNYNIFDLYTSTTSIDAGRDETVISIKLQIFSIQSD